MDEQKHLRKRKQSLKVAELLQEEAHAPKLSPSAIAGYTPSDDTTLYPPSPTGSSSSSSWNSENDSEEHVEATKGGAIVKSSKGNVEGE